MRKHEWKCLLSKSILRPTCSEYLLIPSKICPKLEKKQGKFFSPLCFSSWTSTNYGDRSGLEKNHFTCHYLDCDLHYLIINGAAVLNTFIFMCCGVSLSSPRLDFLAWRPHCQHVLPYCRSFLPESDAPGFFYDKQNASSHTGIMIMKELQNFFPLKEILRIFYPHNNKVPNCLCAMFCFDMW